MRFVSAAMRAKYVVAGYPKHIVHNGPTPVMQPGLTARFFGHVCDTEKQQSELGWTVEERERVETYLLNHKDFNAPGGFYLENIAEASAPKLDKHASRCLAFFKNESGEAEQCPNAPVGDEDYCAQHLAEMAAVAEA